MLNAKQRSFLSGRAAADATTTQLGRGGASEAFVAQLSLLLECHELVKVKFMDFKEARREISEELAAAASCELVRVIGNTAIFFRRQGNPEKRKILFPGEEIGGGDEKPAPAAARKTVSRPGRSPRPEGRRRN
jgi:RNA-binding protein